MTMRALQAQPAHRLLVRPDGRARRAPAHHLHVDACARAVRCRSRPAGRPDVVALKVTTPTGTVLFEGEVAPARPGNTSSLAARQRSVPDDAGTAPVRSDDPAGRRQQARRRRAGFRRAERAWREAGDSPAAVVPRRRRRASSATSAPTPTPRRFPAASSAAPSACCCGSRRSSRRDTPSRYRRSWSTASAPCSPTSRRCPKRQAEP